MSRITRIVRTAAVAVGVGAFVVASAPVSQAVDVPSFPGSLADTDSAVTVQGRGDFGGFSVKVNQTQDLDTQAVSVSWSWPGHPTLTGYLNPPADVTTGWIGNYVQVMQCWGSAVTDPADAANYVADNEGPAREHCEFGGTSEAGGQNNFYSAGQVSRRTGTSRATATSTGTATYYGDETRYPAPVLPAPSPGSPPNPVTSEVPFAAVDGTVVAEQGSGGNWKNPYFGQATTNEVAAAPILGDGTGGTTFQAQNSRIAPGLGCGSAVTPGGPVTPCWLVIVPRGDQTTLAAGRAMRNNDSFFPGNYGTARNDTGNGVLSSPLASSLWANRIAIPLTFRPVVSPCVSADSTHQTVGSGLAADAMLSWQAALCQQTPTVGYENIGVPDQSARDDLSVGASGLRMLSDPLPPSATTVPVTYAPLTVSGVSIGLVFEPGNPLFGKFEPQRASLKLNQRLVAKLLTGSYRNANVYRLQEAANGDPAVGEYGWLADNPVSLVLDPEFLALNPDIAEAFPDLADNSTLNRMDGYVQVQAFGADSSRRVWQWILADPTATAFLAGDDPEPTAKVNPYFSTNAATNPTGTAFDPATYDTLPSLDPWQGDPSGTAKGCTTDPSKYRVGTIDIHPFAADLQAVARDVSRVDNLTKTATFNCPSQNDPTKGVDASKPIGWLSGYTPPAPGGRRAFGLTDSVSAARYGLVTASLPNAAGKYVAPTAASMTAAANHLVAVDGVTGVSQPDLTVKDDAAYPLTMITYGAVTTDTLGTADCSAYASLLAYAAGDGQRSGTAVGDLPAGYAPLTSALTQQTLEASRTVGACPKSPAAPTTDAAVDGGTTALGGGGGGTTPVDAPAAEAVAAAAAGAAGTQPRVGLAASRGTTKPDPSVFAYAVPVAAGVGLLALLLGPVAGLRRRRPSAGSG